MTSTTTHTIESERNVIQPATSTGSETSPRTAAKIGGVGYVLLFVLGIFANFFVLEGLVEPGDAAATAANISGAEGLFRLGLVSFLVVFALDIVVAWALYIVFRATNRDLSLLTAWFRIVYTVMLGVAAVFLFQAIQILGGGESLSVVPTEQLNAQALLAVQMFNSAWLIGLAIFGLHLLALGYLALRSSEAPRILGYVLMVAGVAYVTDTVAHSLLSEYDAYKSVLTAIVAVPSVVGEGWFGLWLLFRAGKNRTESASFDR